MLGQSCKQTRTRWCAHGRRSTYSMPAPYSYFFRGGAFVTRQALLADTPNLSVIMTTPAEPCAKSAQRVAGGGVLHGGGPRGAGRRAAGAAGAAVAALRPRHRRQFQHRRAPGEAAVRVEAGDTAGSPTRGDWQFSYCYRDCSMQPPCLTPREEGGRPAMRILLPDILAVRDVASAGELSSSQSPCGCRSMCISSATCHQSPFWS